MTGRRAEIAGAGLVGLTAAAALARRGWQVRVHEANDDLRMFGAGIWLWDNGLRVLEAIGAVDAAIDDTPRIRRWERRDETGHCFSQATIDGPDRLFIPTRQQVYGAIQRAALDAGVDVVTSSRIVAAEPDGVLVDEAGNRHRADLVIGADGYRSNVRETLGLTRSFSQKREGCTRLLVAKSADEVTDATVEHWSGHRRLLFCPSTGDVSYVCLAARCEDEQGRRVPVDVGSWARSFPHLQPLVDRIGEVGRWDVLSNVVCHAWQVGRAAVLGDAAHAQPPNLGQGANLGFTNALGLAAALDEDGGDVPSSLRRWEARERPLTDHTQRWSNGYGQVVEHWPVPLLGLRSGALSLGSRSRWLGGQLSRAARHVPTGYTAGRVTHMGSMGVR